MINEKLTITILNQLGISKTYKGYHYIISSIQFIHENETTFLPITKNLYIDIAKQYHTSDKCIEKNIRKITEIIWKEKKNPSLICDIFGKDNLTKRLSNTEFLILLYEYIISHTYTDILINLYQKETPFICPFCKTPCEFYSKIIDDMISKKIL